MEFRMIEEVKLDDDIYAIIIRSSYRAEGVKFFTPDNFSQQLGYMRHPRGHEIEPHLHNPILRDVNFTSEVLFIKSGEVRVDFYTNDKKYFGCRSLHQGDIILLAFGGHGFHIMADAEIIEVKQGPYAGDVDKVRFLGVRE